MLLTMLVTYISWSGVFESVESVVVVLRSISHPPLSGRLWFSTAVILSTTTRIRLAGPAEEKHACTLQVFVAVAAMTGPITNGNQQPSIFEALHGVCADSEREGELSDSHAPTLHEEAWGIKTWGNRKGICYPGV